MVVKLLVKPAAVADDDADANADNADDADGDDEDFLKGGQGLSWHELTDDQRVACPTQPPPFVSTDEEEEEEEEDGRADSDIFVGNQKQLQITIWQWDEQA